jgi:hypothetical protein
LSTEGWHFVKTQSELALKNRLLSVGVQELRQS